MCDVVCDATRELFRSGKEELSRNSGFRGSEKIEWDDFWFQKYIFLGRIKSGICWLEFDV